MKQPLLILLCLPMIGFGQTISFYLDVNSGITGVGNNAQVATSDVDNDGDIDVLITADSLSELFFNNGNGSFNMSGSPAMFPQTENWNGSIDFSDIDNDGYQDILFTGNKDANFNLKSEIYRNDATSYFVLVNGTPFTGIEASSVAFADIDNDGDEDLLITGDVGANDFIGLYKNDGSGNFTEDTIFPGSCGVIEGDIDFLDFDGDADLDLIITGFTYDCAYPNVGNVTGAMTILYENDGTGNFTAGSNQPFWGASSSSTSFGDIDGDNDMDIIVSGWDGAGASFTNLGINDGVGNFTLVNGGGGIVEVRNSSVAFADLDNDFDQDLVISGEDNMGQNQTLVYSNDGTGIFTEVQNLNLVAPNNPVFVCVDIDGDVDLDLIIVGDNSTSVYINAPAVYGCTDSLAYNYDSLATIYDSSCIYLLPSIGLTSIPNDNDSVCAIIPRNQGNTWNTINPGDTMADFKLWDINGDSVILSEILNSGKRVLMVSGSYTCPIFRDHMTELNAVAAQFGNQIECFVVYTVEAHPTGSPMPYSGNINPTNPPYYQPNTYGERKTILQDMLNGVGTGSYIPVPINVPIYIDGPCNEWWEYYNGPNNAYLIDTNGILFAYHNWFSNSNPPNGQATNIWCDIDSLLNVSSGGCSTITNTNGTFNFQLKPTSSAMSFGNPGDIIDVFGEIINTSTNGVQVDIRRVMNNLPSPTWSSSMCVTFCLPASQDTTSVLVGPGDTLDFSFHFFTDVLMNGPDTGRARVRFTNANGNQQSITQNYRGITYAQTTSISEDEIQNKKIDKLIDLSGKDSKKRSNRIQIYLFEDGTIEKRIVLE